MGTLNQYLQPSDAPVAAESTDTTSYDFATKYQRNSVTSTKIKSINLNASSGTLNLGSVSNTEGKVFIYNSAGVQLAQIDNNGFYGFGTTFLQYYDSSLGSFTASFGPMTGTAFIQAAIGIPLTINAGTVNLQQGVVNLAAVAGTISNAVLGTPRIIGGTLSSPTIAGTASYAVNAATASLATANQFEFQTLSGTPVLVVKAGTVNWYFQAVGTF
jgi:hypothetical protein